MLNVYQMVSIELAAVKGDGSLVAAAAASSCTESTEESTAQGSSSSGVHRKLTDSAAVTTTTTTTTAEEDSRSKASIKRSDSDRAATTSSNSSATTTPSSTIKKTSKGNQRKKQQLLQPSLSSPNRSKAKPARSVSFIEPAKLAQSLSASSSVSSSSSSSRSSHRTPPKRMASFNATTAGGGGGVSYNNPMTPTTSTTTTPTTTAAAGAAPATSVFTTPTTTNNNVTPSEQTALPPPSLPPPPTSVATFDFVAAAAAAGTAMDGNTNECTTPGSAVDFVHFEAATAARPNHQTYKDRRRTYRLEKKKLADELISAIQDPTILIMSDWLKVRTALKQWNKYYCELRPGSLYLYKNQKTHKSSNWIGTVMLKMCELIERPSKKNGFCFKLFHPLEHPIWAPKGPHGEAFVSLMFGLPASSIIFRAPSIEAGKKWMQAIDLTFKYSNMIIPKATQQQQQPQSRDSTPATPNSLASNGSGSGSNTNINHSSIAHFAMLNSFNNSTSVDRPEDDEMLLLDNGRAKFNETEIESHFDLDDDGHTDHGELDDSQEHHTTESDDDSFGDEEEDEEGEMENIPFDGGDYSKHTLKLSSSGADREVAQTSYVFDGGNEEFGLVGDAGQTEEVAEENKSLLWTLLKQVRPGMDLSKVVLPTFILEPRSFLEKLTDYYYHSDILSKAVLEDDPLLRMKLILKWYLSGFYKKPKGLKKPYNPILGETFRCHWQHPDTGSKTYYIAEQVSHHPPVSAFYITNRQDGFCISGSILTKSKFYGNSISAMLEGTARLTLLTRGEDYLITFPYAHCKGIFLGPLAFELGGKVNISCDKTGYKTELEFKLKPFFSFEDQCNLIAGKLKLGNETLGAIEGHWDSEIFYRDKRRDETELFWSGIDAKVKASRLRRFIVPLAEQCESESERLWSRVTLAIQQQDQQAATVEKTMLEQAQRESCKQRALRMETWQPKLFAFQGHLGDWHYKMADTRPWDVRTDVQQYEHNYVIKTLTRHLNSKPRVLTSKSIDGAAAAGGAGRGGGGHFASLSKSRANKSNFRRHVSCTDSAGALASSPFAGGEKAAAAADDESMLPLSALADASGLAGSSEHQTIKQILTDIKAEVAGLNKSIESLEQAQNRLTKDVNFLGTKICQATYAANKIEGGVGSFSVTRHYVNTFVSWIPDELRTILVFMMMLSLYNWIFVTTTATTPTTTTATLSPPNSSTSPSPLSLSSIPSVSDTSNLSTANASLETAVKSEL